MIQAVRRNGGTAVGRLAAVLLLPMITSAVPPFRLSAQQLAGGRVVKPSTGDSMPVQGVRVVLHQVGRESQGPIDSVVSGRGGRFRFRFSADSAALYLLSARHGGVEFFSAPVLLDAARPDTAISLVVYDTSSTAPIALAARHIVIPRAGEDGTREVLDVVVLVNEGRLARVSPDTLAASWSGPLPAASEGLDVGESDVSPDALSRRGDSVFLAAPIGPGEKRISLQYHVPGDRRQVDIPLGREGGTVNVLVEEPTGMVTGEGLALADTQMIGGRSLRRWTGVMPPGAVISVRLPAPAGAPMNVLGVLVASVVLALAAAAWRLARTSGPRLDAARAPVTSDQLLDRIASLDARYLGREADVEPPEWARYQADRARLKAELESMLALRAPAG